MDDLVKWGGWIVGLLGVLLTAFNSRKKNEIDENGIVFGAWKDLLEAHMEHVKVLEGRIKSLEDSETKSREEVRQLRKRIVELEEENKGLKASIVQGSRSTVTVLGELGAKKDDKPS